MALAHNTSYMDTRIVNILRHQCRETRRPAPTLLICMEGHSYHHSNANSQAYVIGPCLFLM